MKKIQILSMLMHLIIIAFFSKAHTGEPNKPLTKQEYLLIHHLKQSLANAEQGVSALSQEVLSLEGMSSPKVRHLLNNLCSLPEVNYLEVGVWKGSTWIASLYNNSSTVSSAVAIDNWSQFGAPRHQFIKSCNFFLKEMNYQFVDQDAFKINLNLFLNPINLYFYDGDHSILSQEKAFTYFNPIFDNSFIAIVDDWNEPETQIGTYAAFDKLNYELLFEVILPARWNGDIDHWWNGVYAAVIRKTSKESQ